MINMIIVGAVFYTIYACIQGLIKGFRGQS
jgi:hypothetical protein